MTEEKKTPKRPHHIILEDRKNLMISGVSDVDSFDENRVIALTDMGKLMIKGLGLKLNALNVETGELRIEGTIYSLIYGESQQTRGSLRSRLFR